MSNALLLTGLILGLVAGAMLVARSPAFWLELGKIAVAAVLPKFLKVLKPRNLSKTELDEIARGEEPFSTRPFRRQKGE